MKINLEINNTTHSPIEEKFFEEIAEKTLIAANYDFLNLPINEKKINVSVAFVTPAEIRKINKNYRQYDSVTDILSFPEYKSTEDLENEINANNQPEIFLGELILCYNDINEYAKKEGLNFEKELAKVFSHGLLHLLGFSHGEKMFFLQDQVANKTET
ncbi:MAG TPA: rRNA maturation RNase YbeY [Candidatus Moranbacteria bacterium]|nr:rRNA maturation RNase YbeY [Candidatus Moranbacteria bacterium]